MLKKKATVNYEAPRSLVEAENRLVERRNGVTRIDCQLENFVDDGSEEAANWVIRAKDSRNYKMQEIALLELWLVQHQRVASLVSAGQLGLIKEPSSEAVLISLLTTINRVRREKPLAFTRDERLVIDAAAAYVQELDLTSFIEVV
ncbi:MAG: hypothetical protein RBJ76_13550 [Stenomitos frigidus ULC029]